MGFGAEPVERGIKSLDLNLTYSKIKLSSSNWAAVALLSGSGSKHRRMNFCARSDNSVGISG